MNHKDLFKLAVETKSGIFLGKIAGLEVDTDSQSVINYFVKDISILRGRIKRRLVISRNQVISFSQNKMIVDDAALKEADEKYPTKAPEAVIERPNIIQSKN
ncbi:MAG: hypothetical protein PHD51_04660 [Patescibacteria group bacterium]|nr:hypothetical protein [Patescibacteria group bacterium]MDD5490782.1 hypothetical protein [Patescibacteria group bacterium]